VHFGDLIAQVDAGGMVTLLIGQGTFQHRILLAAAVTMALSTGGG
jgi:hypothetical protein